MNAAAWILFNIFVVAMLAVDLFLHRKPHEVRLKEALVWSGIWIGLALVFNAGLYFWQGSESALAFLAGYLIEKSLSVDNLFVFIMIFSYFRIPARYQHEVLFWGILGALVMRAAFIAGGISLMNHFHAVIYFFGAFLIFTGIKMVKDRNKEIHPEKSLVIRLFRKIMPVTDSLENGKFFVKKSGILYATPLFLVLLIVETTDVVFAIDSIPAILSITKDSFIVYTSNVFAILGMRSLYFALSGIIRLFHYLHYGLSAILIFVGAKMLAADIYKVPIGLSLGVVAGILAVSVAASLLRPVPRKEAPAE